MSCKVLFSALFVFTILLQSIAQPPPYKVKLDIQLSDSESGEIILEVHPEWAPLGAERFKLLLSEKFFDSVKFFRVIEGFVAQFGISGSPSIASKWRPQTIQVVRKARYTKL